MSPYLQKIAGLLAVARVQAELINEVHQPAMDYAVLLLRADSLLLRFSHHDDQDFFEIACAMAPDKFHWFGDIEVAMGWSSLERMALRSVSPPIEEVVARLGQHINDLKKLFFKNAELFSQAAVQRTMRPGTIKVQPADRL